MLSHPDAFDVLHLLALVRRMLGQNAEAEALLRRCLALDPASASAHANLGNLLGDSGRPSSRTRSFDVLGRRYFVSATYRFE